MLIGLPPFLIIRFVPLCLIMEMKMWSVKSVPAIYHCRRECHFGKNLRKFLRKFFSQYTTARENAVLTTILKSSFCLPTIPPRKKIRFCRKFSKKFCLPSILTEEKIFVLEKVCKNSCEKISPHSTLTGKAKIQGFLEKFTQISQWRLFATTLNSRERSKVNPLGKKVFSSLLSHEKG